MLDRAGYVFEFVTSLASQRVVFDQTPVEEAAAAFAGYSGFWGHYRVDGAGATIRYQPEGAISPQLMSGREFSRSFEFDGNRLAVTSIAEPQTARGTTLVWDRVPTISHGSPLYHRILGFWQHVTEKRVSATTGAVLSETARAPSVLVYTPSGFVGTHFPPLNRKSFAAETPTPDEARAALTGYVGYYGALGVYSGEIAHNVLAGVYPAQGSILRRFVEINGDELTLRLPPACTRHGEEAATAIVTLRRLSGEAEMLPRR